MYMTVFFTAKTHRATPVNGLDKVNAKGPIERADGSKAYWCDMFPHATSNQWDLKETLARVNPGLVASSIEIIDVSFFYND